MGPHQLNLDNCLRPPRVLAPPPESHGGRKLQERYSPGARAAIETRTPATTRGITSPVDDFPGHQLPPAHKNDRPSRFSATSAAVQPLGRRHRPPGASAPGIYTLGPMPDASWNLQPNYRNPRRAAGRSSGSPAGVPAAPGTSRRTPGEPRNSHRDSHRSPGIPPNTGPTPGISRRNAGRTPQNSRRKPSALPQSPVGSRAHSQKLPLACRPQSQKLPPASAGALESPAARRASLGTPAGIPGALPESPAGVLGASRREVPPRPPGVTSTPGLGCWASINRRSFGIYARLTLGPASDRRRRTWPTRTPVPGDRPCVAQSSRPTRPAAYRCTSS